MNKQVNLYYTKREMAFTMELWKVVLEIEEMVRNHYLKLAEREIYDLQNEEDKPIS